MITIMPSVYLQIKLDTIIKNRKMFIKQYRNYKDQHFYQDSMFKYEELIKNFRLAIIHLKELEKL